MEDTTIKACFGTCDDDGTCDSVIIGINDFEINHNLFTLQPTIANNFTTINFGENFINQEKQVLLISSTGQHTSDYANGLYSLTVIAKASKFTKKLIIMK